MAIADRWNDKTQANDPKKSQSNHLSDTIDDRLTLHLECGILTRKLSVHPAQVNLRHIKRLAVEFVLEIHQLSDSNNNKPKSQCCVETPNQTPTSSEPIQRYDNDINSLLTCPTINETQQLVDSFRTRSTTNTKNVDAYQAKNQQHNASLETILYDRIILRKLNQTDESLSALNSIDEIEPDCYIVIGVRHPSLQATGGSLSRLIGVSPLEADYKPNQSTALATSNLWTPDLGLDAIIVGKSGIDQAKLAMSLTTSQTTPSPTSSASSASTSTSNNMFQKSPTNITPSTTSMASSPSGTPNNPISPVPDPSSTISTTMGALHEFKLETYYLPTFCASCSALLKGLIRQGHQCTGCKRNFCSKCKARIELAGEICALGVGSSQVSSSISSSSSSASTSNHLSASFQQIVSVQNINNKCQNSFSQQSTVDCHLGADQETLASSSVMPKRKSGSNLLHFTIANPFKSHHQSQQQQQQQHQQSQSQSQQQQQKLRGSGALDPVLQQLSRQLKDEQRNQNLLSTSQTAAHLSSSHQNLCAAPISEMTSNSAGQANSVHQSPITATKTQSQYQLSKSARTSVQDMLHQQGAGQQCSGTSRGPGHTFISMEWIKVNDTTSCGVCNKQLRSNSLLASLSSAVSSQSQAPVLCRVCNLQVHAQCRQLASDDCLARITEMTNRVAEEERRRLSDSNNNGANKMSPRRSLSSDISDDGDDQKRRHQNQMHPRPTSSRGSDGLVMAASGSAGGISEQSAPVRQEVKSSGSNVSRDNIRLHRLAPSVKHVKRPDSTQPIIEGWLRHTTLSDEQTRQHYWRLDETDITLYENATSTRYFKAIALSRIKRVMSAHSLPKLVREDVLAGGKIGSSNDRLNKVVKSANTSPAKSPELTGQMKAIFAFELETGSMYLVQAEDELQAERWRQSLADVMEKRRRIEPESRVDDESSLSREKRDEKGPSDVPHRQHQATSDAVQSQLSDEKTRPEGCGLTVSTAAGEIGSDLVNSEKASIDGHSTDGTTKTAGTPAAIAETPTTAAERRTARHHHHFHHHHHHHQFQTNTKPTTSSQMRSRLPTDRPSRLTGRTRITIKLEPMAIPDHLIEGKYLIECDRIKGVGFEELGSGQFGKVYAAISDWRAENTSKGLWSGVPVAIKEISKARFDLRQQAKLKNEANILSRLDHPGIIILERVHDLPDKIYIVMEQLEDDMLEMIVSTEEKRLNERITKFLTYQILQALRYLHSQNIVHCDLKPENVLLVERRSQFPQIKLCDFGFAKIIEENSFRSSLVGTPAYLAPEVVKGERYNRGVDLWSVGVIIYVSLSGEFPFNEGENIHEQISRANFMFPAQPWAKISGQARSLISSLLRINCDKRLSASKALMDEWFTDYQLWCDLSELEVRVGRRWVTDDAEFDRWSHYSRKHNLQLPKSAVLLHEQYIESCRY